MTGRMKELICIITKNRTLPTLGSYRPENKRYVEQERKMIFLWQLTCQYIERPVSAKALCNTIIIRVYSNSPCIIQQKVPKCCVFSPMAPVTQAPFDVRRSSIYLRRFANAMVVVIAGPLKVPWRSPIMSWPRIIFSKRNCYDFFWDKCLKTRSYEYECSTGDQTIILSLQIFLDHRS